MKVLITGASGQVGRELIYTSPKNIELVPLDKYALDISNYEDVKKIFKIHNPVFVINTAAYTSVEKAEVEENLAYQVNKNGVENIALACKENHTRLIHFSTDYVFDGTKTSPYNLQDIPNPINVYGQSKLEGEKAALEIIKENTIIIRTSWIYSKHGNNFVNTMLKLMNNNDRINVITDQTGTPTWARSVANITWCFVRHPEFKGIFNFTDSGSTNWFEFAKAIQEEAIKLELLDKLALIQPISSKEYGSKTNRPVYSVLDCSETWNSIENMSVNWRTSLINMLYDLKQQSS